MSPAPHYTALCLAYGNVIPISFGKRRLPGTVIQSSNLVPKLIGTKEYTLAYQIPIYEDKSQENPDETQVVSGGVGRPRPDPANPPSPCGTTDPCNPVEDLDEGGEGGGGGDDERPVRRFGQQ